LNGLGGMIYENGYNSEHVARVYGDLINSDHHRSCVTHYAAQINNEDGAECAATSLLEIANKLPSPQVIAASNFDTVPLMLD